MSTDTATIEALARQLIALESARAPSGVAGAAVRACEKFRDPLSKLVGLTGFRSLLSRAVALAKAENPSFEKVHVGPDGSLEGFDEASLRDAEEGVVLVARLLGLLAAFIGAPLTRRLVTDSWPDASVTENDPGTEERP